MLSNQVVIRLVYTGKNISCPECGDTCNINDHAPEQKWRHLDTMQFETILFARLPRVNCNEHGVKTAGATLLGLNWHAVDQIMRRAVARGMKRRTTETMEHLGLDEKSFRAGHQYINTLNDLDEGRVLEVVETRTTEATEKLLTSLAAERREKVKSVAIDMWKPFVAAVRSLLSKADIVHDRFHKYLNEAVDKVQRQESRNLNVIGDKTLIGSKYAWLRNPENMTETQRTSFEQLMACELKTGQGWGLNHVQNVLAVHLPRHCQLLLQLLEQSCRPFRTEPDDKGQRHDGAPPEQHPELFQAPDNQRGFGRAEQ